MTNSSDPGEGSTRPYLLRAIYEWAIDQHMTPQVLVETGVEGVVVPTDFIKDGRIVLTIHPQSVQNLEMGNEYLQFSARFSGKPFEVCIPVAAVSAIYCRENGRGIVFQEEIGNPDPPPAGNGNKGTKKSAGPVASHLKLVK